MGGKVIESIELHEAGLNPRLEAALTVFEMAEVVRKSY